MGASPGSSGLTEQRLDLWLWCARFRRQRADCAELVAAGSVRINRRPVDRPGARVRPGDVLTVALGSADPPFGETDLDGSGRLGGRIRVVRVLALSERRGNAADAARLFEEIAEP